MHLLRLDVVGFRNLRDQVLEIPPEGVAILGRNAQGKTNLLEAIHYLETFRSFRGARDDRLVRSGDALFRLTGTLRSEPHARPPATSGGASCAPPAEAATDEGGGRMVSVAFQASTREKRVRLDDRTVPRMVDAIGRLGVVLFTPDDVRLVSDGPAERRRFLDILLSLHDRNYLSALQRFRQALANRNAALRRGEPPASVEAWNGILVDAGSRVSFGRAAWVRGRGEAFTAHAAAVAGDAGARMQYEPSVPGADGAPDAEAIRGAFEAALDQAREGERRMRTTLVGPHRDELRFFLLASRGERDAREFGSGGQRRTVALALRLIEADTVRDRGRGEPILLLDDAFAELDEDRSARLLALLDRTVPGQVLLTAPKEADVRFRRDMLPRWTLDAGEVTP